MKFISYENGGASGFGIVGDDGAGLFELAGRLGVAALRDAIAGDLLGKARDLAAAGSPDLALADVTLARPVPYPEKTICIGVNYGNRNEEYKDNSGAPAYPSVFMRVPDSLAPHGAPILRPPESEQLDYEGEIVLIVGKPGRRIPPDKARDHIAGLTIMNEGTIRDWLRHGKFNVTPGKNFIASGGLGPWMVPVDDIPDFADISVQTRVNGEVRQDDTTANMIFDIPYLMNYLSTFMELKPGDVIATGTPVGAGARFDPPKWLVPGDVVEVEVSGVGTLSNPIADEN